LDQASGVQMRFLASVSIGIFVYIDPVKRAATITDVQVESETIRLSIRNDGNAPLGVDGRVEFTRVGEQKPTATSVIPRQTILTEPVRSAFLSANLPEGKDLPAGEYMVRAIVDIGLEHYIGVQKRIQVQR